MMDTSAVIDALKHNSCFGTTSRLGTVIRAGGGRLAQLGVTDVPVQGA